MQDAVANQAAIIQKSVQGCFPEIFGAAIIHSVQIAQRFQGKIESAIQTFGKTHWVFPFVQ